jgi:hypothetical protein
MAKDRNGNELKLGDYVYEIGAPFEAGKVIGIDGKTVAVYYGPSVYREAKATPSDLAEIGEGDCEYEAYDLLKISPPATPSGDWEIVGPIVN